MGNFQDLTGQRFGRLKVIKQGETFVSQSGRRRVRWWCKCRCGFSKLVLGESLKAGSTTSCGCRKRETGRENAIKRRGTHVKAVRDTEIPEYRIWCGMRQRCYDQNCRSYPDYGGRGIRVCKRWRKSFKKFLKDMGERPSPKHQIDRKENDGGYRPDNCRWATKTEQMNNRRNSVFITLDGITKSVRQWEKAKGLPLKTVFQRMSRGWTARKSILTPLGPSRKGVV